MGNSPERKPEKAKAKAKNSTPAGSPPAADKTKVIPRNRSA